MTQDYYRNEYSEKGWQRLIDKALELGCQVRWSRYGNIAEIDSTAKETALMCNAGSREMWAGTIHQMIQDASEVYGFAIIDSLDNKRVCWYKNRQRAWEQAEEYATHTGRPYTVRKFELPL